MTSNYVSKLRSKIGHMETFSPAVTLIIYKAGKVLLQKRADNGTWGTHGGGIEPGENFIDTLYREIKEELNIKPINPVLMGIYSGEQMFHIYPNGDRVYILNHTFICEDYEGTIKFSDGEVKEVKWFELDNLPENILEVDKPIINSVNEFIKSGKKTIVN